MKYLICGLPGSGKTTYVKNSLGMDGLCYDLDAIAAALRLRGPHEENHAQARGLANKMLFAFCSYARDFARDVYIIRTAPQIEEMRRIMPDKVIICKNRYVRRGTAGANEAELVKRLEAVEDYCRRYNIQVETQA